MRERRTYYVKKAAYIAIAGNTVLAALTIVVGFLSGSRAVVGAGIDTTTDIITSVITLLAAMIMGKPPDEKHPYGHRRAEVIATKVVAFVIFFAGAQLAMSTARTVIAGERAVVPGIAAVYVTIVSVIGKVFLAFTQFRLGRRYESPMIIANGRNMLNDIYISSGVLVGLLFTLVLELPILDSIVAFLVSLWVMKTAVQVFMESTIEVMEGTHDSTVYEEIFKSVSAVEGASNPHRTRIRQISNLYVIDMDIEVDPSVTVKRGHDIAAAVEAKIKENVRNVYDIIVHVEPYGNKEENERYGLSESP